MAGKLIVNGAEIAVTVIDDKDYISLTDMLKAYSADDGNTEVFYFEDATATFSSFTHKPEVVKF